MFYSHKIQPMYFYVTSCFIEWCERADRQTTTETADRHDEMMSREVDELFKSRLHVPLEKRLELFKLL